MFNNGWETLVYEVSCDGLEMVATICSKVVVSISFILEEGRESSPESMKFGQGP
jgi:hypothetical protein